MQKHLKVKIIGQVQGVGFRWCSYEKFVELGLTGKVENAKDGSVEVDAEGEDFAIEKFVDWAHKGPAGAKVAKVEIVEAPLAAKEPAQAQ